MNPRRFTPDIDPMTLILLVVLFVFLIIRAGGFETLLSPQFGMKPIPETGQIMVQDFSNLYHYVRGVFHRISDHPYRIDEMNAMLTNWTRGAAGFMPFLSPPTILLTFAPLTLFPSGIAYLCWMLISFIGAAWCSTTFRQLNITGYRWPLAIACLCTINLTSLMAINLGQTVFLTNTALLGILLLSRNSSSTGRIIGIAVLLLLLTGKPQVSLVAVFFLMAEGQWKALFLAGVACLFFCLAVTPLFGWSWPLDYLHTMSVYGSDTAPLVIRETIGTSIMTNFRAVCVEWGWLSDRTAISLSWLLFLGTGLGLVGLKMKHSGLPTSLIFSLAGLIYLLWSPHLNPHEDLLLLPVLFALLAALPRRTTAHWIGAALVAVFTLQLSMDMGLGFTEILRPSHHVFWTKLILALYAAWITLRLMFATNASANGTPPNTTAAAPAAE